MSHLSSRHGTEATEIYDEMTEMLNGSIRNSHDDDIQASNHSSSSLTRSSSPMEKSRKPADSFEYSDTPTLRDEFISRPRNSNQTSRASRAKYWLNKMTLKSRRKSSFDEHEGFEDFNTDTTSDVGDGLLTGLHKTSRRQTRRNGIFNYFVFGGISGLGIL